MKAEEWMTRRVQTCHPETSLNEAAHLMWEGDCGVLPVVDDDGRAVGLITDRDICMGAHFQGKDLGGMKVADSMSHRVFACQTSDPIEQVIRCMGDHRVRRVPLLDGAGRVAGILSLNDLVRRLVALSERERSRMTPRFVEALASICESPCQHALPEPTPAARAAGVPVATG